MMDTPRRDLRHAVFISFRSDDGGYAAAQIDGKLREIFGDRHIFRSAHAIPSAPPFPTSCSPRCGRRASWSRSSDLGGPP